MEKWANRTVIGVYALEYIYCWIIEHLLCATAFKFSVLCLVVISSLSSVVHHWILKWECSSLCLGLMLFRELLSSYWKEVQKVTWLHMTLPYTLITLRTVSGMILIPRHCFSLHVRQLHTPSPKQKGRTNRLFLLNIKSVQMSVSSFCVNSLLL